MQGSFYDLLTPGQLRFYPRALTGANIQELFQYGATFEDISTGSVAHDVAPIAVAGRYIP